jgi:hypothetical protein
MEHVLVHAAAPSVDEDADADADADEDAAAMQHQHQHHDEEEEDIDEMGAAMMGLTITHVPSSPAFYPVAPPPSCLPSPTFYPVTSAPSCLPSPILSFAGVHFKEEKDWGGESAELGEPVQETIERKIALLDELLMKNPTTNLNAFRVLSTLVSLCQRPGVITSGVQRMFVRSCALAWKDLSPVVARSPVICEEVSRLITVCA